MWPFYSATCGGWSRSWIFTVARRRPKANSADQLVESARELTELIDLNHTIANFEETFSRSRDGLKRIKQIIQDLRDFARLDRSERQEADLNAGIESTLNIARGHAKRKQVRIETDLRPLPSLLCHPAKINQVVMNVVLNAIEASSPERVVTVRSSSADGQVRIEVADRGSGIDPSIVARIFDPFFTTKPIGQGTGLGLSISYGIVHEHGGSIEVKSEPGQGSTFTIFLPVAAPPAI